jgi:hypothetical protein
MSPHYTEPGVTIPPTEAAIVTASDMTELELVLPQAGDFETLPEAALFLAACALRYHDDPRFVEAQLSWLKKHRGSEA